MIFVQNTKTYKITVKMVKKDGHIKVTGVELKKDGKWGSKFVHLMRFVGDVVHVESELENASSLWGDQ